MEGLRQEANLLMQVEFEYKSFSFKKKENQYLFNKLPTTQYSSKSSPVLPPQETSCTPNIFELSSEEDSKDANWIEQFQTFWGIQESNVLSGFTPKTLMELEMESLQSSQEKMYNKEYLQKLLNSQQNLEEWKKSPDLDWNVSIGDLREEVQKSQIIISTLQEENKWLDFQLLELMKEKTVLEESRKMALISEQNHLRKNEELERELNQYKLEKETQRRSFEQKLLLLQQSLENSQDLNSKLKDELKQKGESEFREENESLKEQVLFLQENQWKLMDQLE